MGVASLLCDPFLSLWIPTLLESLLSSTWFLLGRASSLLWWQICTWMPILKLVVGTCHWEFLCVGKPAMSLSIFLGSHITSTSLPRDISSSANGVPLESTLLSLLSGLAVMEPNLFHKGPLILGNLLCLVSSSRTFNSRKAPFCFCTITLNIALSWVNDGAAAWGSFATLMMQDSKRMWRERERERELD